MNWDIVKGRLKRFGGKLKAQWGKLTGDHPDVISGKFRMELAGKIQAFYGITEDEAEQRIKNFELRATRTAVRNILPVPTQAQQSHPRHERRCASRVASLRGLST